MAYDARCFDLAELFLSDTPEICTERNKRRLAQHIQSSVEDWIAYQEGQCDACGESRGNCICDNRAQREKFAQTASSTRKKPMPYDIHIDQLQEAIAAHAKWGPLAGADRVRFLALALCGEVGELANLIKKDWRADSGSRREAIKEELADVANYAFMLSEVLGFDLPKAMLAKLREVERRPEWRGPRVLG